MIKNVINSALKGVVIIPPSKSDAQRALLCAALANGVSEIENIGKSQDVLSMLNCIQQLGAKVTFNENSVSILGIESFPESVGLNIGESGLGLRLLSGILAVNIGDQIIDGEGSILQRDQSFFKTYFSKNGVNVIERNSRLPIQFSGKLLGGEMVVDGSQSSQYISGLLMGLPLLNKDTTLTVLNSTSTPYIEMTIATLKAFGIEIVNKNFKEYFIKGNQEYSSQSYEVESDWSSASCWFSAAALGHDIKLSGLNFETNQADFDMLQVLKNANCSIIKENGIVTIDSSEKKPFSFNASNCPDLFPAIVVLAAFCDGPSTIKGVNRLSNKESDRGLVLQKEFGKLGLKIDILDDEMIIHGGSHLVSTEVDSHNDHRIAMCLAIAATLTAEGLLIKRAEAVSKSYPEFWDDLSNLID